MPVSAIPCLNYRKALKKEEELKTMLDEKKLSETRNSTSEKPPEEVSSTNETCDKNEAAVNSAPIPVGVPAKQTSQENEKERHPGLALTAKIETVMENLKAQSLTADDVNGYCKNLFIFKTIRVMRFK